MVFILLSPHPSANFFFTCIYVELMCRVNKQERSLWIIFTWISADLDFPLSIVALCSTLYLISIVFEELGFSIRLFLSSYPLRFSVLAIRN